MELAVSQQNTNEQPKHQPNSHIEVKGFELPQSVMIKALTSGLPNHISLQIALRVDGNIVKRGSIDYKVTYDLWDEVFLVHISQGPDQQHVVLKDTTLLFNELSNTRLTMHVPHSVQELSIQMVVNPIEASRIKRIHRWIAQSKGHDVDESQPEQVRSISDRQRATLSDGIGSGDAYTGAYSSSPNPIKPRFEKLFDKLLKEYADPNDIPALWKSAVYVMSLQPRLPRHAKSFN
jgi:hypothetical protein